MQVSILNFLPFAILYFNTRALYIVLILAGRAIIASCRTEFFKYPNNEKRHSAE